MPKHKSKATESVASFRSIFGIRKSSGKQPERPKRDFAVLEDLAEESIDDEVIPELGQPGPSIPRAGIESSDNTGLVGSPQPNTRTFDSAIPEGEEGFTVPTKRKQARRQTEIAPRRDRVQRTAPVLTAASSQNWRDRQPLPKIVPTEVRHAMYGGLPVSGLRTLSGVPHQMLIKGHIVWRQDWRRVADSSFKLTDPDYQKKPDGSVWHAKGRYFVIIYSTKTKVWDIPIYTNGDTGLASVDRKFWKNYIELCPVGVSKAQFKKCGPNEVASIDWVAPKDPTKPMKTKPMRNTMIAHFAAPREHSIDEHPCRIFGTIDETDVNYICRKAGQYLNL